MTIYRSYNDIIISFIEYLRLVQPELDTKPGTVARDLFIDSPAQQVSELYKQLRSISELQSLFSTSGRDLSRLASNFGVYRKTGSYSSGVAILTTNDLGTDTFISAGDIIVANNGVNFRVVTSTLMSVANSNVYRANAMRLRTELDIASITDQFAIEVNVEALITGISGNIGQYSLISHNIVGISNVTNTQTFSGGSDIESDNSFRNRILSVFSGSNTGTALGYTNAVNSIDGVSDSIIVTPGDPLLIRDGTQVTTNSDGDLVVSEPGSGGKVDIYVLGSQLERRIDTYIYNDQSGKNDPTDPSNDRVLGQRGQSTALNVAQRRVSLIGTDNLPYQPVSGVISISGSSSGTNFVQKYTDSNGRVKGNYELIKDTGDFSGSSFGFDRLRWISNKIQLSAEEVVKGTFNGVDELNYSDIQGISNITQNFLVTNENATISSSDRSIVTLKHTPIGNVSRIVNLTTGERYVVEDKNPDGNAGDYNITGRIVISGSTLPVSTDVLQVDYTWIKQFDPIFDFDNLSDINIDRTTQDSIDWSFSNLVRNEDAYVLDNGLGALTITLEHPVYKILGVNTYTSYTTTVNNGIVTANVSVSNIIDIKRVSDNAEVYNTDISNGTLTGTNSVILPSDSIAEDGDTVIMRFNSTDIFSPSGYDPGTFSSNIISLPDGIVSGGTDVLVSYIANVLYMISPMNIGNLPAIQSENKFLISNVESGNQPTSNIFDNNGNIIGNLRRASSNLRVSVGSISSSGSVSILGKTIKKVTDALVTVTSGSGYEVDLRSAILSDLGVSSIPTTIKVINLYSLERLNVSSSGDIESVDNIYDIINYKLNDNSYDLNRALQDSNITKTKIVLPETSNNTSAQLETGDIVRVTFYYMNTNDSELLYFSKNGEQVTNKVFSSVTKIYSSYGFKNPVGDYTGTISVSNFNQPSGNTSYFVDYDFISPKENERITITFNHNNLINTISNTIEDVRPITADVLIKEAKEKSIDSIIKVVLLPEYQSQEQTVLQDATDAIISFLTSSSLGITIDASDITKTLYSVQGIDRVTIISFSYGDSGNVLSITADRNEYLTAGTIVITTEER